MKKIIRKQNKEEAMTMLTKMMMMVMIMTLPILLTSLSLVSLQKNKPDLPESLYFSSLYSRGLKNIVITVVCVFVLTYKIKYCEIKKPKKNYKNETTKKQKNKKKDM